MNTHPIPIYMRIGDSPEHQVGTIEIDCTSPQDVMLDAAALVEQVATAMKKQAEVAR